MTEDLWRMPPRAVATGWVTGRVAAPPRAPAPPGARAAIAQLLLPALQGSPCMVAFSGGRDSSAMLAVATDLARRHGMALPVPVTRVFSGDELAEEQQWQEQVVRHLGLDEWVRLPFDDELDLLGPIATEGLRRHGLLWPPMLYTSYPLFDVAAGGALVSGEGGDEVLGPHRVTPLVELLRRERPINRRSLRRAAGALAPGTVRAWRAHRRGGQAIPPWLRPDLAKEHRRALRRDDAGEPLRYSRAVERLLTRRAVRLAFHNLDVLARRAGVRYVHPFLDPTVVRAVARNAGTLGPTSRTQAMRALFADVLPDAVLSRQTKALFNTALFNRHSRAFVARWRGDGVDPALVDPEALRTVWSQPMVHGGSFALLQSAWLETEARTASG